MLNSGDIVELDLGVPSGSEAGFPRPAVVVSAQTILNHNPSVVQVVPLTRTIRSVASEISINATELTGLVAPSAAQCHQIRAVATSRINATLGNIGPTDLYRIREILALLLDIDA